MGTRKTFVEDLTARAGDPPTAITCQWQDCTELATQAVGQWDAATQSEDDASIHALCFTHTLLVQQMADEGE